MPCIYYVMENFYVFNTHSMAFNDITHLFNIPRACLLNRSPVPAIDLKSNRSGL